MEDQWIKLVEYGEYPHEEGIQCLNRFSAEEMSRRFHSLSSRFVRRFKGIPIYIGHPDDPKFYNQKGHRDLRVYAWVKSMEAREDALWILPQWSEVGLKLMKNAFFKYFSPRWRMKKIGQGRFEPVQLLSVGLTNNPNILGKSITDFVNPRKEVDPETDAPTVQDHFLEKANTLHSIVQLLEFGDEEVSQEDILQKIRSLLTDAKKWREEGVNFLQVQQELQRDVDRFYKLSCSQQDRISELSLQVEQLKTRAKEQFISHALKQGLITPAEVENWGKKFEEDPELAEKLILDCLPQPKVTLNTTSRTANLRNISFQNKEQIISRVRERMQLTGEGYTEAWNAVKTQFSSLF